MPEIDEAQQRLEEEVYAWAKDYAKEHGWSLNYIEKQLKAVVRGLARNTIRHGERYCPCRIRTGDAETDKEIICPCIYHEKELSTQGYCHCNLFFDDKFFENLLKEEKIPEPKHPLVERQHEE
jgi:ferredoxin-thioredoxin reductase catalytic chain